MNNNRSVRYGLIGLSFALSAAAMAQQAVTPALPGMNDASANLKQTAPENALPAADSRVQESMIAYAQGTANFKNGAIEEAIAKFKDAIVLNPQEETYRYMLAEVYGRAGKWLNRWFQLRQALLIKPDFAEATEAFLGMWQVALDQGQLDVGTPSSAVLAALGEADVKREEGPAVSWQYAFMTVDFYQDKLSSVTDLRGLDRYSGPADVVEMDFDNRHWVLKQRRISAHQTTMEYMPDSNDSGQREVLTFERLHGIELKPKEMMTTVQSNLQTQFDSVEWQVLDEKAADDLLFEYQLEVPGQLSQHEIVRLMTGRQDVHRVAYTAEHIDDRAIWVKRLASAALVPLKKE